MAYNIQLNYDYIRKIRQVCSGEIFVQLVLISCNFVGYFVSKLGICIRDGNVTPSSVPHEGLTISKVIARLYQEHAGELLTIRKQKRV